MSSGWGQNHDGRLFRHTTPLDEPKYSSTQASTGDKRTVLVVDDEPTVRLLVTEVLVELGYTSLEAADGPSGLDILRSGEQIDLLVTDVGPPGGMNGHQLADAARVARPGLAILFITGYAEAAVSSEENLGPGMLLLAKPFTLESLAARIRELMP